jgi:DNA processing protein
MAGTLDLRTTSDLVALLSQRGVGQRSALLAAVRSRLPKDVNPDVWPAAVGRAEEAISGWRASGVETIGFFDPAYPPALRELDDAPPVIWIRGNPFALHLRGVAVVGTREPTKYGTQVAEAVACHAVAAGWVVVSGLARGVDTAAHWATVNNRGVGVAVMAGGLDRVYPAENKALAKEILGADGALIAEVPPGTSPRAGSFIARDRLQSALARALFICQTGRAGGTLHTARFAVRQGKLLFCPNARPPVPPESEGLRLLLDVPGQLLPNMLREWAGDQHLVRKLPRGPVAQGFQRRDLPGLLDWLSYMEGAEDADFLSPTDARIAERNGVDSTLQFAF